MSEPRLFRALRHRNFRLYIGGALPLPLGARVPPVAPRLLAYPPPHLPPLLRPRRVPRPRPGRGPGGRRGGGLVLRLERPQLPGGDREPGPDPGRSPAVGKAARLGPRGDPSRLALRGRPPARAGVAPPPWSGEPDGDALHGPHADLRGPDPGGRRARARHPARRLRGGRPDGGPAPRAPG